MWDKIRGRKGYFQIALSLGIGLSLLALVAVALQSGTIQDFGHYPVPAVQRAAAPEHFWLAVGFWAVLGSTSLLMGVSSVRFRLRKTPAARMRKKATQALAAQTQVRSVEVGAGPDPPWVRFPGSLETFPEAAMGSYFEKEFAPFWLALNPEARAAYLRRNPPPSPEWQGMVDGLMELE